MRLLSLILGLCLAITAMSCSTMTVRHDYDTEADFASLETYRWVGSKPSLKPTQMGLFDKRIKNVVNSQLTAKGYESRSINPDFLVAYHVGVKNKIDVQDWGYTYGPRGYRWGGRDISVQQYSEGTLILDVVDPKTKQLIWRGVAQGVVDPGASPEKKEKKLNEAVSKILEKFPPLAQTS